MRLRPPFAPARLRLAEVFAARAVVRAVFAAERAVFAVERARFLVLRAVLRARFLVLRELLFVLRDRLLPPELRLRPLLELLRRDDDDDLRLRPPFVLRSGAGISSRAVLRTSFGISFSR